MQGQIPPAGDDPKENPPSQVPIGPSWKRRVLRGIYFNFYRIHAYMFLFSMLILIPAQIFSIYIPVAQEFAAGFLVFWLPGFCVMFLLWDSRAFKTIYLLPLTLAFSQVIVISAGLVCSIFGILWTPASIIIISIGFTYASVGIARKTKGFRLNQAIRLKKCYSFEDFYQRFSTGKIIPKNFGYLLGFLVLLGIYYVVSYPVLKDDDSWFHAAILHEMMESGIVPFNRFRGAIGLHIFSGAFGLLVGWSPLTVAQWFPVYLEINGCLAFYLLVHRLLKNAQIANLGTFFIAFTHLGYAYGINWFWANALGEPFGLYIMFFMIDANLRDNLTSGQKRIYVLICIYFSFILRVMHDAIFLVYFLSILFVQIMYGKNRKSQLTNIAVILASLGVFLLYDYLYPSIIFTNPLVLLSMPSYLLVLLIPGIYIAFKLIKKMLNVPPGNFEVFMAGQAQDAQCFYQFERKYFKFAMVAVFILGVLILVLNVLSTLDFESVIGLALNSRTVIDLLVLFGGSLEFAVCILGIVIIRRKEKNGKIIFLWSLFFLCSFIGYFFYDLIFYYGLLYARMMVFANPALFVAGSAYLYYVLNARHLKQGAIRKYLKLFALIILTVNLAEEPILWTSASSQNISSTQQLGENLPPDSVVIGSFRWDHSLTFFSANFDIDFRDADLDHLYPETTDANAQYFYSFRAGNPNRSVFLILDSSYIRTPIASISRPYFNPMTLEQVYAYENISYLNHVHGYWVDTGEWMLVFSLV